MMTEVLSLSHHVCLLCSWHFLVFHPSGAGTATAAVAVCGATLLSALVSAENWWQYQV